MAEFKITNALKAEIFATQQSCKLINSDYSDISKDKLDTLNTSVEYISQHKSIKQLLELYRALIEKDIKDMEKMVLEASQMDATIATSHKA